MGKYQHSFKKMETSEAVQKMAEEKMDLLINKFLSAADMCHMTYSVEGSENSVHCHLSSSHHTFEADHKGDNMYAVLDKVVSKIDSQLRSLKGKKDRSNRRNSIKHQASEEAAKEEFLDHEIDGADIVKMNK